MTGENDGEGVLPPWSPTRRGARQLIATAPTEPALVVPGLPGLDHMRLWACRTGIHTALPIALMTTNRIGKPIRISLLRQYSPSQFVDIIAADDQPPSLALDLAQLGGVDTTPFRPQATAMSVAECNAVMGLPPCAVLSH